MFRRNRLRKSLFFVLMFIILTQSGSSKNPEAVEDISKVEQREEVKITSDNQVFIYQKGQNEQVLTQEIETGTKVLGTFLTGQFLIIEEEDYYLTLFIQFSVINLLFFLKIYLKEGGGKIKLKNKIDLKMIDYEQYLQIKRNGISGLGLYERDRKMDSLMKEYFWRDRIQLNREQKVEEVEIEENSLAVSFKQKKDLYDLSTKTWSNIRNERIMEASAPTFQPLVHISTEATSVYTMKIAGDYLLYSGFQSQMKLAKYDGCQFQQVFVTPDNSYTYAVALDIKRKWLFHGLHFQTNFYADEGSGYQLKQIFQKTGSINYTRLMDIHQQHLIIRDHTGFHLYEWDGEKFNLQHNFTQDINQQFWGTKICSEDTIIAAIFYPVDGTYRPALRVYNSSNNYQLIQELLIDEFRHTPYTLAPTETCQTVILTPIPIVAGDPAQIYIFYRNATGNFFQFNSYPQPRYVYTSPACVHPDGDFFIVPRVNGSDLWIKDHETGQYAYDSILGSSPTNYSSCVINRQLVALVVTGLNVSFSLYQPKTKMDPREYGKKTEVQISEPQLLPQAQSKVIDFAFAGDYLVVGDQYSGSSAYTQESGSFSLNHTLDHGKFLSSMDSEDSLQLLVQGSYDQTAYVYKDSGSGLSSVQNITTESQILAVDLDADGRLLLGHMNGDISEYFWDSSVFNAEDKFPTTGGRIYGVKSCPKEEIVALKEKEGRFYLVRVGSTGFEKQSIQLDELVGVKFAVSDDCRRVFISNTMQMQVQVFVMEEGKYSLFRTVQENFPLYDIAIHSQADMFMVNRHTDHSSVMYRYDSCTEDYELDKVFEGDSDYVAVEMTDDRIGLADLNGKVTVHDYTYLIREECSFGEKKLTSPISDVTTVAAPRSITDMDVSSELVVASSLYTGVLLFQIPDSGEPSVTTFDDSIFISSVSIVSALRTFAVGTFNKSVLVYTSSGSGYGPGSGSCYQLSQTIQTDSQVTSIDLCEENKLLVGMMNGDLAEYSFDGSSFSSPVNTSNANSQAYAVELCPGGTKVALLEAAGVFSLTIFPADSSESVSFTEELQDEFIEPYLSVSKGCLTIAVSGVSMQKVQVFRKETDYQLFKSIEVGSPLSRVSVEEEGDILIVPSVISPESYVYHYHQCTDTYSLIDTLESGTYDESTAINSRFILQGNFDGTIKISEYSYIYNATCESIADSSTVRQKSSQNPEAENSENLEDDFKKILATDIKNQHQLSSQANTMAPGILLLIGLGFAIVLVIFVTFIRWIGKKERKNQEKATAESAKQIQSQQTF